MNVPKFTRGEASARAWADAEQIVRRVVFGTDRTKDVAREYGTSCDTIQNICEKNATPRQRAEAKRRKKMGRENPKSIPVGTVRVHQKKRGGGHRRMIKVRDDGPRAERWVPFGSWLWEQTHGPTPAGHRIMHLDGDTLNDDIGNLGPVSLADLPAFMERIHPDLPALRAKRNREEAAARTGWRRRARELSAVRAESDPLRIEAKPTQRKPTTARDKARLRLNEFLRELEVVA